MFHFIKVESLWSCFVFKGMGDIEEKFLVCVLRELTSNEGRLTGAKEIPSLKKKKKKKILLICQTSVNYK